jgi:hypothetical protein
MSTILQTKKERIFIANCKYGAQTINRDKIEAISTFETVFREIGAP